MNLLTVSEGPLLAMPVKGGTPAVSEEAGSDGLVRWLRFIGSPAQSQYVYAPAALPLVGGDVYNISVFVRMDDGLAPAPGVQTASADFSLIMGGSGVISTYSVTLMSGDLYRVSAANVCRVNPLQFNNGVLKYNNQSSRGFRVSGYQLTAGPGLQPYQRQGS